MASSSRLDPYGRYILPDFQQQRPFASFLPGIAGLLGTPMWAFYVNRGQAIAGFGVESKDSPLMEFQPANKAYQSTPMLGFRTFLKLKQGGETAQVEPFGQWGGESAALRMLIGANELIIEETDSARGLLTRITYFTLPGESFAGLARMVTLQNLGDTPLEIEALDGLPVLLPYGVSNGLLKDLGRTVEAWMEVYNHASGLPFYAVRASIVDKVEVETYQAGNFALSWVENAGVPTLLPALVDPVTVFGTDTSFTRPSPFYAQPLADLLACQQITCGRTPCGMFAHTAVLQPGESLTLYGLYGHISGQAALEKAAQRITQPGYLTRKLAEAQALADDLSAAAATHSADPIFDAYCRQNFLDNVLRGGWPVQLGPHTYPVYSRKHGDLERDYNAFFLAPEPYSQGEGSYRDVNQNRRDTVWFNPRAGDFDIRTFMSLIQADGYNPRTVRGSSFTLDAQYHAHVLAHATPPEKLRGLLAGRFTPGKLIKAVQDFDISLDVAPEALVALALEHAEQHIEAEFFEGYWIDHWEYNLDLIESYLAIYPERKADLLFGGPGLPFYDSPAVVQPRARRYVLLNGAPRQVGSLLEDEEKAALIANRATESNWARAENGQGEVYRASLFAKLLLTVLLKFATLDPLGMGIEMEASRPGWYDALNGLPGLFGSGMSEAYELKRWIAFLRVATREFQENGTGEDTEQRKVNLPAEAAELMRLVLRELVVYQNSDDPNRDFTYWDAVSTAREVYRARTRLGFDGAETTLTLNTLGSVLEAFEGKLAAGMQRARALNNGLPPTYFSFQVDDYELAGGADSAGRPYIRVRRFSPRVLPLFLEGPVHAYKVSTHEEARMLYQGVKASALFDEKLKMYRVNASLESQPHDIGRARAFPRGWLENESIWMHMEYKYLLEVLRAGLYEEFYVDFRACLVPFLDPQVYGRSPLENSSFLVSSAHPDASLHGAGFVARLTGSTAEFISMWLAMMAGRQPFIMHEGQLALALRPALPGWLFDEAGVLSFRFLNACTVTLHNPRRADTYRLDPTTWRAVLRIPGQAEVSVEGGVIPQPYAALVRDGGVDGIDLYL